MTPDQLTALRSRNETRRAIKRYDLEQTYTGGYMRENAHGDWVASDFFDSVLAQLEKAEAHIQRLTFAVNEARRCCLPPIFGTPQEEVHRLMGIYTAALDATAAGGEGK